MNHYYATPEHLDLLALWNHQLIRDEGHRNPMTVSQLRERMAAWLRDEYKAVVFALENNPVAYALYREQESEIYIRQFFVDRAQRRQGLGKSAFEVLRGVYWPAHKRLTLDVLTQNHAAIAFWRSVGFQDYCITLEILPANFVKTP